MTAPVMGRLDTDLRQLHAFDPDVLWAPICTECGKLMPCPTVQLIDQTQARWWVTTDKRVLSRIGDHTCWPTYTGTPERLTALTIDLGGKVVDLSPSPDGHYMRLVGNPNRVYVHCVGRPGPQWVPA